MAPLAIHTVPELDLLAQTRETRIVSQLPAAALWLLVITNMGYATLASLSPLSPGEPVAMLSFKSK
jgi:hypothetical protein